MNVDLDTVAKDMLLELIATKMRENPEVLAAGESGYETAKNFIPWASDDQISDVWFMVVNIMEGAEVVAEASNENMAEIVKAVIAGGVVSAGYASAKSKGLL